MNPGVIGEPLMYLSNTSSPWRSAKCSAKLGEQENSGGVLVGDERLLRLDEGVRGLADWFCIRCFLLKAGDKRFNSPGMGLNNAFFEASDRVK